MYPKTEPTTRPVPETTNAIVDRSSLRVFATAPMISPTEPNNSGTNKNATAPNTIEVVERELLFETSPIELETTAGV